MGVGNLQKVISRLKSMTWNNAVQSVRQDAMWHAIWTLKCNVLDNRDMTKLDYRENNQDMTTLIEVLEVWLSVWDPTDW